MRRLLIIGLLVIGCGAPSATRPPTPVPTPRATSPIVGTFLRWEAVDDKRGYAYFKITNNGTAPATAKCSIRVRNDFGNFGFDSLVGEVVQPSQTITGRIPISVGEGSRLINQGEVTDC